MADRFVEVFAGAYASGKSETSINRARQFAEKGEKITLVDLDTVEPAYTLRPIANELQSLGINVITQPDNFGLGEAASYITPAQVNCLSQDGNIIIDVGYGAGGLDILDIITNIGEEKDLKIYLVVNTSKFETSTVDNIIEYVTFSEGLEKRQWKKFAGIVSNTHFGDETTKEDIINGYEKLKKAALHVNLPIISIGVPENLSSEFEQTYDGVDIWVYKRMMPKAFW
ncbi:MAG: hypothetical protein NC408_07645 [Candidatus Gastranaerophilales bacterium]|nr:hypothetical protein [Candidatus Gastranaerophilales bacterium]MCM1072507.1 hypothetical protein [Bacteroides sp.]